MGRGMWGYGDENEAHTQSLTEKKTKESSRSSRFHGEGTRLDFSSRDLKKAESTNR